MVERLTALPADPGPAGTVAMRRLGAITRAVSQTPDQFPREDWPASLCAQVVTLLRGSPRFLSYATDIAIALTCQHADSPAGTAGPISDADRAGWIAEGPGEVAALIGDRPALAAAAAKDVVRALLGNGYRSRPEVGAAVLLDICAPRQRARPRVGLVSRGGSQGSWPQEWTGLLDTLRRSPHEEVSRMAWETR